MLGIMAPQQWKHICKQMDQTEVDGILRKQNSHACRKELKWEKIRNEII